MSNEDKSTPEGEDIYNAEERDELEESDEIEPWEEGFMEGEEGQNAKCRSCGGVLLEEKPSRRRLRSRWCGSARSTARRSTAQSSSYPCIPRQFSAGDPKNHR